MRFFNYNLLFVLLAAAGIVGGIGWGVKNYLFYQNSLPATGTVIKVAHMSRYDSQTHSNKYYDYPLIEFTAKDGNQYRFFGRSSISATGYKVEVLYSADDPQKAYVKDLTLWLYPVIALFIGLVFSYSTSSNLKAEREARG
ncbi:MAG: DUF3592 domain-containing protein [Daejeonella sp.]